MPMKLNKQAVTHARKLIKAGKVVHDELGDWSGHQLERRGRDRVGEVQRLEPTT